MAKPVELGLAVIGVAEQLHPRFRRSSDLSQNDVYVGTVFFPHDQSRVRAYVKMFRPKSRGQLVYNEVIAHHLATLCGLPSPRTFPCVCRPSQLRSATRAAMVDRSFNAALSNSDSASSFFNFEFSDSSSLKRRASDTVIPPYFAFQL